ncbi:uncharacterized protein I303_103897 [Kwoniella dejecticola CBS 10117]|uniref:Uncharacterized protein n=1 Tax=Kwoniella dejecticola CBS 10117 TaxID=1296121 RepID=A0A1A6A813_9TREE|nr:uncharacterized protein I303_03916 [Kwoniella dejecticola CBS 10117]OBR86196.1 hypothetical protein I303_03916 [Kwoniella dejecticola CBS 10117]
MRLPSLLEKSLDLTIWKPPSLKALPQFKRMVVPGHNKLYIVVHQLNKEKFQKVMAWVDVFSIYAFALHVDTSKGDLYVIATRNGDFKRLEVFELCKSVCNSAYTSPEVVFEIVNQPSPKR